MQQQQQQHQQYITSKISSSITTTTTTTSTATTTGAEAPSLSIDLIQCNHVFECSLQNQQQQQHPIPQEQ